MTDLTSVGIPRPRRIVTGFSNISGFMGCSFPSCPIVWLDEREALETLPAYDHVLTARDGRGCKRSKARAIRLPPAPFDFRPRRFLISTTKFFTTCFFIAD